MAGTLERVQKDHVDRKRARSSMFPVESAPAKDQREKMPIVGSVVKAHGGGRAWGLAKCPQNAEQNQEETSEKKKNRNKKGSARAQGKKLHASKEVLQKVRAGQGGRNRSGREGRSPVPT